MFQPNQFEQRQKSYDDFRTARGLLEQFGKLQRRPGVDGLPQQLDFFADRPFVFKNVTRPFALLKAFENVADRVDEVEQRNFGARRRTGRLEFQDPRQARENFSLFGFALMQLSGGVLEFLVLDQLADQIPARVFFLLAFGQHLLVQRKQLAAFDIHEGRSHHQKLAGHFKVEFAHQLDVLDELRGDLREVDLVNVHLLLLHQIKEQVERAFEDLKLDFIFGHQRTGGLPSTVAAS